MHDHPQHGVPKKKSYRAIALTSVMSKWYATCMNLLLQKDMTRHDLTTLREDPTSVRNLALRTRVRGHIPVKKESVGLENLAQSSYVDL